MTLITINNMSIPDTSELGQDERSFQPLIYPEYVFYWIHSSSPRDFVALAIAAAVALRQSPVATMWRFLSRPRKLFHNL